MGSEGRRIGSSRLALDMQWICLSTPPPHPKKLINQSMRGEVVVCLRHSRQNTDRMWILNEPLRWAQLCPETKTRHGDYQTVKPGDKRSWLWQEENLGSSVKVELQPRGLVCGGRDEAGVVQEQRLSTSNLNICPWPYKIVILGEFRPGPQFGVWLWEF